MALEALRAYLERARAGILTDTRLIADLLASEWHELDGGAADGMQGFKLLNRMENVQWQPPTLVFDIERHGGTVFGSTRAEMQRWAVNVHAGTAEVWPVGRRQLYPMDKRLDVKPLATRIAQAIQQQRPTKELKWRPDGTARLLLDQIIPTTNKQTTTARRRRFADALFDALKGTAWAIVRVPGQGWIAQRRPRKPVKKARH